MNLWLPPRPHSLLSSLPPSRKPFTVVVKFIVRKLLNVTLVGGNPEQAPALTRATFSQLIMCGRATPCAVRLPDTYHIHVNEGGGLGLFERLQGKQAD